MRIICLVNVSSKSQQHRFIMILDLKRDNATKEIMDINPLIHYLGQSRSEFQCSMCLSLKRELGSGIL